MSFVRVSELNYGVADLAINLDQVVAIGFYPATETDPAFVGIHVQGGINYRVAGEDIAKLEAALS